MKVVFPYDGYEHIGIGYLAAVAEQAGHQVCLCRVRIGDYIVGYRRLSRAAVEREKGRILAEKPDVVAFSLVSPCAASMIAIAKSIRNAGIKTIAGGSHATAEPEVTIRENAFDLLVKGEAEEAIVDTLDAVFKTSSVLPKWLYTPDRPASQELPHPDINKLPFPAKKLFYRDSPYLSHDYMILSSRGCPYECIFCTMSGKKRNYRRRAPDSVLAELRWAKINFSPRTIYFIDDAFGLDIQWLKEFLPYYRKEIFLPFHAITHPLHFDTEKASLMREAGCFSLRIGVQTLTPRIKKRLGRPETNEQVASAIRAAQQAGIRLEIDHMVDLPDETIEEARSAIRFYAIHRPDAIKVYWLMPLPGSRWFNEAQEEGRLSGELAGAMRRGDGFGSHSYLFKQRNYSNRRWLGIATLLTYLSHLPPGVVRFCLSIKADRYVGLPSFFLLVGLSRLFHIRHGWDKVGEAHFYRIRHHVISFLLRILGSERLNPQSRRMIQ